MNSFKSEINYGYENEIRHITGKYSMKLQRYDEIQTVYQYVHLLENNQWLNY